MATQHQAVETKEKSFDMKTLKFRTSKKNIVDESKTSELKTKSSMKRSIRKLVKTLSSKRLKKSISKRLFRKSKKNSTKLKAQKENGIEQDASDVSGSREATENTESTSWSGSGSIVDNDTNRTCLLTPPSSVDVSYAENETLENPTSTIDEKPSSTFESIVEEPSEKLSIHSNSIGDNVNDEIVLNNDDGNDGSDQSVLSRSSRVGKIEDSRKDDIIRDESESVAKDESVSSDTPLVVLQNSVTPKEEDDLDYADATKDATKIQPLNTTLNAPSVAESSEEQKMMNSFILASDTLFIANESGSTLERRNDTHDTKQPWFLNLFMHCTGTEEPKKEGLLG